MSPAYKVEHSLPACFAPHVLAAAGRSAIESEGRCFTYGELDRLSNEVAWELLDRTGEAAEPIAFLLGSKTAQIVALLGILKAGKVYVPLETTFPAPRIATMLEHSRARLLISDRANRELAQRLSATVWMFDIDAAGPGRADVPALTIEPQRPAYILYTSGSTGQPKGVVHSHRTVLHYVRKYSHSLDISAGDRVGLFGSCSFASGTNDLFLALLNGATVCPIDMQEGLASLARQLVEQRVTVCYFVPTLFRHFVATLRDTDRFPDLRLIRLTGETVTSKDVELYQKHFEAHCDLVVSFGATEIHGIRQNRFTKQSPLPGVRVPVGYALPETEVLLLDDAGKEVGLGAVGQIAVRSRYLASGYWQAPELTEQAFRSDPQEDGMRIYVTGDLGCLRPDGSLEHLGRKDAQVKVNGQRVDAIEIEAALADSGLVYEAAVVVREERLVAYCVPAASGKPTRRALRAVLTDRFPEFMIPASWVMLDALPLTATGKIDRRRLPDPQDLQSLPADDYVPPADVFQLQIAQVWERLLGMPVGVRHNFFDLGGSSLLAMEMLDQLAQLYGRRLSPGLLLERPTVELLSEAIHGGNAGSPSRLVPVQPGTARRPFFFLHGDICGGGYCVPLAKELGSDQPFYALQPHGLDGDDMPCTIEAMAAEHLAALCAFQPHGPYLLGGHCNGALVAFEMAQCLRRRGERVDLLVMIEPPAAGKLAVHTAQTLNVGLCGTAADTASLCGVTGEDRFQLVLATYRQAFERYFPRPYAGRLSLFFPSASVQTAGDATLGWQRLAAGPAEVHVLPGRFHTTVSTHLSLLGQHLCACLREAPARPAEPNATRKAPLVDRAPAALAGSTANPGRNDPCPCGSGKKFKKCCRLVARR